MLRAKRLTGPPRARNEIPKAVRNFIPSERGLIARASPRRIIALTHQARSSRFPSGMESPVRDNKKIEQLVLLDLVLILTCKFITSPLPTFLIFSLVAPCVPLPDTCKFLTFCACSPTLKNAPAALLSRLLSRLCGENRALSRKNRYVFEFL